MQTRPMTQKCRVATVVIGVPGRPRTRMGPLMWNFLRWESKQDFSIDGQEWMRNGQENGEVRDLSAREAVFRIQCGLSVGQ